MYLAAPGSLRMTQGSCYKEDGLSQFVSAQPFVQKVLSLIPKRPHVLLSTSFPSI